jgi:hypothetical protein
VHLQKGGALGLLACQIDFLIVLNDYTNRDGVGDTVSRSSGPVRTAL